MSSSLQGRGLAGGVHRADGGPLSLSHTLSLTLSLSLSLSLSSSRSLCRLPSLPRSHSSVCAWHWGLAGGVWQVGCIAPMAAHCAIGYGGLGVYGVGVWGGEREREREGESEEGAGPLPSTRPYTRLFWGEVMKRMGDQVDGCLEGGVHRADGAPFSLTHSLSLSLFHIFSLFLPLSPPLTLVCVRTQTIVREGERGGDKEKERKVE